MDGTEEKVEIAGIPTVIYGKESQKVFLFVHGQGGRKEEGKRFAQVVERLGYQVLAMDLPQHGARADSTLFLPWEVIPELQTLYRYATERWNKISLRTTSIGTYFAHQIVCRKRKKFPQHSGKRSRGTIYSLPKHTRCRPLRIALQFYMPRGTS